MSLAVFCKGVRSKLYRTTLLFEGEKIQFRNVLENSDEKILIIMSDPFFFLSFIQETPLPTLYTNKCSLPCNRLENKIVRNFTVVLHGLSK